MRKSADAVLFVSKREPILWAMTAVTALPLVSVVGLLILRSSSANTAPASVDWMGWFGAIFLPLLFAIKVLAVAPPSAIERTVDESWHAGLWRVALSPAALVLLVSVVVFAMIAMTSGAHVFEWIWRCTLVLLSATLFLAMVWLSGRYVLCADSETEGQMRFTVWTMMGRRVQIWPTASLSNPVFHDGRTDIPGQVSVDAPYISLRSHGDIVLIVDMQGTFPRGTQVFLDAVRGLADHPCT